MQITRESIQLCYNNSQGQLKVYLDASTKVINKICGILVTKIYNARSNEYLLSNARSRAYKRGMARPEGSEPAWRLVQTELSLALVNHRYHHTKPTCGLISLTQQPKHVAITLINTCGVLTGKMAARQVDQDKPKLTVSR